MRNQDPVGDRGNERYLSIAELLLNKVGFVKGIGVSVALFGVIFGCSSPTNMHSAECDKTTGSILRVGIDIIAMYCHGSCGRINATEGIRCAS